jgi:hypothetical protein
MQSERPRSILPQQSPPLVNAAARAPRGVNRAASRCAFLTLNGGTCGAYARVAGAARSRPFAAATAR